MLLSTSSSLFAVLSVLQHSTLQEWYGLASCLEGQRDEAEFMLNLPSVVSKGEKEKKKERKVLNSIAKYQSI